MADALELLDGRLMQPSRSAISALVYLQLPQRHARSASSPNCSRSQRHSSAAAPPEQG
jgi:hypothetical protein